MVSIDTEYISGDRQSFAMPYGINDRGVNPGEVNLVRDMEVLIDVSDLVEVKWIAVF